MRRFPFNPFTTDAERLQREDKRLRDQDAAEKLAKATDRTGASPQRLTPAQARSYAEVRVETLRSLRDEPKGVQDVVGPISERYTGDITANGITFHRPCPCYVWCDHHGEIHAARPDIYGEHIGELEQSECVSANWRNVFVESLDPEETF